LVWWHSLKPWRTLKGRQHPGRRHESDTPRRPELDPSTTDFIPGADAPSFRALMIMNPTTGGGRRKRPLGRIRSSQPRARPKWRFRGALDGPSFPDCQAKKRSPLTTSFSPRCSGSKRKNFRGRCSLGRLNRIAAKKKKLRTRAICLLIRRFRPVNRTSIFPEVLRGRVSPSAPPPSCSGAR